MKTIKKAHKIVWELIKELQEETIATPTGLKREQLSNGIIFLMKAGEEFQTLMNKANNDELILSKAKKKWGKTHHINKVFGTDVNLTTLPKGVGVICGDGDTYHFQLIKK